MLSRKSSAWRARGERGLVGFGDSRACCGLGLPPQRQLHVQQRLYLLQRRVRLISRRRHMQLSELALHEDGLRTMGVPQYWGGGTRLKGER